MSTRGVQPPLPCVFREGRAAHRRAASASYLFPELGCSLGGKKKKKGQVRVTNTFGETKFCVNHSRMQLNPSSCRAHHVPSCLAAPSSPGFPSAMRNTPTGGGDHIWPEPRGGENTPCSALAPPDPSVLRRARVTLHRAETVEVGGNSPAEHHATRARPCLAGAPGSKLRSPARPAGLCSAALEGVKRCTALVPGLSLRPRLLPAPRMPQPSPLPPSLSSRALGEPAPQELPPRDSPELGLLELVASRDVLENFIQLQGARGLFTTCPLLSKDVFNE